MANQAHTAVTGDQAYPLPFFDLSQALLPKSIHSIYKWCLHYYVATPLIPAVINKLSIYPVTKPIISQVTSKVQHKWEDLLLDKLDIQFKLVEINLDWCLFGNAFIALYVPFKRFLGCKECHHKQAMKGSDWRIKFKAKGVSFQHRCNVCKKIVNSDIFDLRIADPDKFNIIRYDPESIRTIQDVATGRLKYLWRIPTKYKAIIKGGEHPSMIEDAPFEVLEAIAKGKDLELDKDNIFHMKRPNPSGVFDGLGLPLVVHALKWTYYLATLQRAQEAIANDKLTPTDFLFPGTGSGSVNPASITLNYHEFMDEVKEGLKRKAKDPNHKILLPGPVGQVRVGGDGRAMLLSQEIEWVSKQIIASMGVPVEFVYGGLTWTGSSITLRMLENSFTGMRDRCDRFLRFIVNRVGATLKWQIPKIKLSELKMADDVQRQQLAMQLEASKKISTTTLLSEFNYDLKDEAKLRKEEYFTFMADMIRDTIASTTAQGEAGIVSGNYSMRAQLIQEQQSASMQQNQQQQTDSNTGLPIDPQTGLPIDANGQYYDPQTGQPLTPDGAEQAMQMIQEQQAAQQPAGPQPTQGNQAGPGSAVDNQIYSQQEAANDQNNAAAKQAGSYENSPENVKQIITMWVNRLSQMDHFSQQQVLAKLQQDRPDIAQLIQQQLQVAGV